MCPRCVCFPSERPLGFLPQSVFRAQINVPQEVFMYRGCNLESIRMDLVSACAREYRAFVIVCTVLVTFMTFWLGGRRSGAAEPASHTTGVRQSLQPNSNSELARTHASTKAACSITDEPFSLGKPL